MRLPIKNLRPVLQAAFMCLFTAIAAQAQPPASCQIAFFKVVLDAHHDFQIELGGGLLFRVRSEKEPGWFIDIVPAEAASNDYIYPANLPLQDNPNQTLGPGDGETVQSSLSHPHEMRFLLDRAGYERVSALIGNVLASYKTPDPDKALSEFTAAVDDARKGSLKVTIASYKTDKAGALTHIKLRVAITTPLDFQFAPRLIPFPSPCHP